MTTELQNKVWSILPKEFKEEVKEIYLNAVEHHPCGYNHKTDLLKYLFGHHNLTSDEEGEEMLICEKSKVQRAYNTSREIVKAENPDSLMYSMHTQIMCVLENIFGSKCLPDANEDNFVSIEPKPAEPKFKVGDKVRLKDVYEIEEIDEDRAMVGLKGCAYMEDIDNLEPYTEPKEEADKQFDNILKEGFSKERRLNIAKDFASVLLSRLNYDPFTAQINCCCSDGAAVNPYINIARIALSVADALIAESEKEDSK